LESFASILKRFGQGDLNLRLPVNGKDEIEQLAGSFNQMADGLQARDKENARLYHELQEKEAARTQLLQQIIANQEEDRKRLSRGLHDDFSQSLTALSMTMQTALQRIPPGRSPLRDQLEQLQSLTVDTLAEASRWIQDLRPRLLDDMGLVPAIRSYAESRLETCDTRWDIQTHGLADRLPTEIETTLFRIIQEAVSNIANHAHARHARISIDLYETGSIVARVEDDGVGFIPGKYHHALDGLRGVGLMSMRERVTWLGGTLRIASTPGRGTVVRAEVPWKANSTPSGS
ncbi:MAG TPA: ATP-binding protein, partial [Armatimonadota bacterium]|nr:ATP-binding protein [Armatimonadota bacterium]